MCRLFGFRSIITSQIHSSLVDADNALLDQSETQTDGWGVAYYIADAPHIVKSTSAAGQDQLFRRVSGLVTSPTVIAHLRKATIGTTDITNTHPFQYGRWVFAHNGNIKDFHSRFREHIAGMIAPALRRFILGHTDSEYLFYFLLSEIARTTPLERPICDVEDVMQAIEAALASLKKIIGPIHDVENGPPDQTYLTFLLTNGTTMLGYAGGQRLHYSTYKTQCPDRVTCPYFADECENTSKNGFVNHLLFSSEKIAGENVWLPMHKGQLIGVDSRMRLHERTIV